MTGITYQAAVAAPAPPVSRVAQLQYPVLLESAACVIPAAALMMLGQPTLGAYWLFACALAFVATNFLFSTRASALALLVALLPAISILKAAFFWNSVPILLGIGILALVLRSPRDLVVLRRPAVTWLFLAAIVYWLVSWMLTKDYTRNLRATELACTATVILLLARHPEHLATALIAAAVSLTAMGVALLGHGDRLGIAVIAGVRLGNPVTFGVPAALLLILANVDGGKWLMLQRRPGLRIVLSCALGTQLLLSTSRASWLIAAVATLIVILVSRRGRIMALGSVVLLALATWGVMHSKYGESLRDGFERTFSDDRSWSNRSSGRSDQWKVFPAVLRELPPWGFGPGRGGSVYAKYSRRDPKIRFMRGADFPWHSMYQHVTVETGLIGVSALLLLFWNMLRLNRHLWRTRQELMPLLGTVGFMLVALTVSAMDAASGMYLGFGLLTYSRG